MMRTAALAAAFLLSTNAVAMVGDAPVATPADGARHAVLLVGSRGNSCTGTAIARDLVLTAAHCVAPGADYRLVEYDSARRPTLKAVTQVLRHPNFSLQTFVAHSATADVALLRLAEPLPASIEPAAISADPAPTMVSEAFVVAGFGLTVPGDGRSGGTLRAANLVATGKPGSLQLRLVDPATQNKRPGLGACTADSGAPVFRRRADGLVMIGLVSWSTGPNNAAGCGGLTGVTPLARYRGWIVDTARRLGSAIGP